MYKIIDTNGNNIPEFPTMIGSDRLWEILRSDNNKGLVIETGTDNDTLQRWPVKSIVNDTITVEKVTNEHSN